MKRPLNIPRYFCWTRFGTEAAQTISQIIERKEEERVSGGGVFLWGIGNSVGQSIVDLIKISKRPEVLFSPIRSAPKTCDVNPCSVVAWTVARGIENEPYLLPEQALVTSRFDPASPKRTHYALVCHSETPLALSSGGETIQFGKLRNLVTQRPVGASQVTAVVEYGDGRADHSARYEVAIRTSLVAPYFIRLHQPIPLAATDVPGFRSFDFAAARAAIRQQRVETDVTQMKLALHGA